MKGTQVETMTLHAQIDLLVAVLANHAKLGRKVSPQQGTHPTSDSRRKP